MPARRQRGIDRGQVRGANLIVVSIPRAAAISASSPNSSRLRLRSGSRLTVLILRTPISAIVSRSAALPLMSLPGRTVHPSPSEIESAPS